MVLVFFRMRGSLLSRRTEQRLRQLAISTVGSVKIKLLLFLCIAFTLFALLSPGSGFTGWTSPSGPPDLLPFPRFVKYSLSLFLFLCDYQLNQFTNNIFILSNLFLYSKINTFVYFFRSH